MKVIRCDGCNLELEGKEYLEIGEISKHVPGSSNFNVRTQYTDDVEITTESNRSWVDYKDLHFCMACLSISPLIQYLNIEDVA